eukprot:1157509-Pelagomonas_calceolata.AAC.14
MMREQMMRQQMMSHAYCSKHGWQEQILSLPAALLPLICCAVRLLWGALPDHKLKKKVHKGTT